jgi:CheY-like chemotaxis protein
MPAPLPADSLSGLQLLLVEDHEDTRELLAMSLRRAGATVIEAPSVSVAIEELRNGDFAVLVSDIGMPDQDGYDLMRWVRSSDAPEKTRAIPAIAVTAFTDLEHRKRALAVGFAEHLAKPVKLTTLIAAVARLGSAP